MLNFNNEERFSHILPTSEPENQGCGSKKIFSECGFVINFGFRFESGNGSGLLSKTPFLFFHEVTIHSSRLKI
jgi:hypothetical protein